jgi:hypothetical protein
MNDEQGRYRGFFAVFADETKIAISSSASRRNSPSLDSSTRCASIKSSNQ